jgi:hypothetical protein
VRKVFDWIKGNPLLAGIALLVLVVLLIWFSDAIGGQVERFNRWRHDKAIAAEQAEIKRLKDENAKLLQEAKTAYALGAAKELERDAAYAELEKYGAQARAAVEAQKEAAEEYAKNQADIAADVPMHVRCNDLCRARQEIGKPCPASYCDRYIGR